MKKIAGVLTNESESKQTSMRCMLYREIAVVTTGPRKGEIVLCVKEVSPTLVISLSSDTKWTITNDHDQTVEGFDIPKVEPYKRSTLLLKIE